MPKFTRIPYDVEAYRVTKGNLEDLVNFSTVTHMGFRSDLTENKDGILVRGVGTLQSAYVGDWVVRLESGHIETLTDRKFNSRYRLAFVPECSDGCGYQSVSNGEVGTNPSGLGADIAKTVGNTNSGDADRYKEEDSHDYIRRNTPSVKAIFYDGKNIEQVKDFLKEHYIVIYAKDSNLGAEYENTESLITTKIDNYCVIPKNRWVVLEPSGDIYPVSRDIFELTFIHKLGGSNV